MAGKMMLVNPRRRSASKRRAPAKRRTSTKRRRTPARRTTQAVRRRQRAAPARRRRRRNPSPRGAMRFVRPALMGGATAIGIDVAMGYAPLPDVLSQGYARHATKAAIAVGLGMYGAKLGMKRATAESMAQGALTVFATDAMREAATQFMPNVPMGYYSPAYVPPSSDGGNMGMYLNAPAQGGMNGVYPMGVSNMDTSSFGMYTDAGMDSEGTYYG